MSVKKPYFAEGQIYHIYNRGVEKREIFMQTGDYFRMVHDMFELNDLDAIVNTVRHLNPHKSMEARPHYIHTERKPRKILVKILAFALMPNHYHLLLEQVRPGGIIKFMQKLGTAYTMYFNKIYERVGPLLQGRFKAVHVNQDAHFVHLPFYIHANPIDLMYRGPTSNTSTTSMSPMEFLKNYRWSSFPDYVGIKNFPSVTSREFLLEFFGGEKEYEQATEQWLAERNEHESEITDLIIDPE
ncbi:MAG: transposase [Candidatus Liptonbacteria bacterium]|nr:transposase [Candidatus Liptonbacteria bacterium]